MIYFAMNFVVNNLVNKIAICLLHDDPQIWGQKINFAICKFPFNERVEFSLYAVLIL